MGQRSGPPTGAAVTGATGAGEACANAGRAGAA
jgi:hypothetical protein